MSPGPDILNPRGNLALGCKTAFLRLADTFLFINFFLLKIRPIVLADTSNPFLFKSTWILYLDQAGYCFFNLTVSETISQEVVGCLKFFGRRDCSFSPIIPKRSNFFCQSRAVFLVSPKCLEVKDTFLPFRRCQSNIFNRCLARSVNG